ncbi:MAG: hypothetical protein GF392_06270 [Candidatus Omnitrophica bacterium]|nr:hypothetical protein [Candidatus Omnitrophota bacterium]
MKRLSALALILTLAFISGCGYTTASMLPPEMDSIHIKNFENKIDVEHVVSDKRSTYDYWPALEVDITRAVINSFIFDGTLAVTSERDAKMVLEGMLVDFKLFPLSYDKSDNINEFRVSVTVDLTLYNNVTGEVMWKEPAFQGQSTFTTVGPNALTEGEAVREAVKDLSARVVERVIEVW